MILLFLVSKNRHRRQTLQTMTPLQALHTRGLELNTLMRSPLLNSMGASRIQFTEQTATPARPTLLLKWRLVMKKSIWALWEASLFARTSPKSEDPLLRDINTTGALHHRLARGNAPTRMCALPLQRRGAGCELALQVNMRKAAYMGCVPLPSPLLRIAKHRGMAIQVK